jgi:hypothetical protein
MTVIGRVVDGRIVLDAGAVIPDGTEVRVYVRDPGPVPPADTPPGPVARLLALAGTVPDLPPDFAYQHDHYRLGTPKRPTSAGDDLVPDAGAIAFLRRLADAPASPNGNTPWAEPPALGETE